MNKKDLSTDALLADLFHDDWSSSPPPPFARRAAAHARHRRQLRHVLVLTGTVAGIATLFFIAPRFTTPAAHQPAARHGAPACEIISDAELLAQLQDRPVLVLPEPDGSQIIVPLDL